MLTTSNERPATPHRYVAPTESRRLEGYAANNATAARFHKLYIGLRCNTAAEAISLVDTERRVIANEAEAKNDLARRDFWERQIGSRTLVLQLNAQRFVAIDISKLVKHR